MRTRWWAVPLLLAGSAAALVACGSSSPSTSASSPPGSPAASSPAAAGTVAINTRSTSIGTVLTNTSGKTLYWFAIDTPTTSNCNGSCATYWPPVIGTPQAASGVSLSGSFGTIKRSDGTMQATYDGHPLYTYAGDSAPGMTSGNGKNLSGGLWWAMTPTGTKPAGAPSSSPSSSPSSGGYGY